MHPYITELVANERIESLRQEAAANRRAREALRRLRLPRVPHLDRQRNRRKLFPPSRPATA
jgi:hypothetical protein